MQHKLYIPKNIMDIHIDILCIYQNKDRLDIVFEKDNTIEVRDKNGTLGYIKRQKDGYGILSRGYLWGNQLLEYLFTKPEFHSFLTDLRKETRIERDTTQK